VLQYEYMLFAIGILATTFGAAAIIANSLRNAPEAYEDKHGFHVIRKRASGGGILLRRKYAGHHGSGSLKAVRIPL
jgi:hypothetical protein